MMRVGVRGSASGRVRIPQVSVGMHYAHVYAPVHVPAYARRRVCAYTCVPPRSRVCA